MRLAAAIRMAVFSAAMTIAAIPVFACKCASAFHGKNAWESAKLEADGSTAIFEGIAQRIEAEWSLLDALVSSKDGDLLPVPNINKDYPHVIVTFRADKIYKGDVGPDIKVRTGLGGGDCGAVFFPGLIYLVYGTGSYWL